MKRTTSLAASTLVAIALVGCGDSWSSSAPSGPGAGASGSRQEGSWRGAIGVGATVEIKGIHGAIRASASSGSEVVVSWVKEGRQDHASTVRIDVVEHADGVTLCAVYPDVPGMSPNECLPGLAGDMHVQSNDVEVTFAVKLPHGVHFIGRTLVGDVEAAGVDGSAFGYAMAGDVDISTSGLAGAVAINGSITASLGLADWGRDLAFTTVKGSIYVEIPANTNAEVRALAPNGSVSSDFPLVDSGLGWMTGTLGTGGPNLRLSTNDGNITLRRRSVGVGGVSLRRTR